MVWFPVPALSSPPAIVAHVPSTADTLVFLFLDHTDILALGFQTSCSFAWNDLPSHALQAHSHIIAAGWLPLEAAPQELESGRWEVPEGILVGSSP